MKNCTDFVYGCRPEILQLCELWEPGVSIMLHAGGKYHAYLLDHLLPRLPGDGWSSRVLDAVVHGCIPVIVQDESEMFFEGAFAAAGSASTTPTSRCGSPRTAALARHDAQGDPAISRRRDARARAPRARLLVYKDMYSPDADERRELLKAGRPNQDAFLLLAMALEARARPDACRPTRRRGGRAIVGCSGYVNRIFQA